MLTKKFNYYIQGIKTEVYYNDEDNFFHCWNILGEIKNYSINSALQEVERKLKDYREKIIKPLDNYSNIFTTDKDITEVPSNVKIFLGTEEILNKAVFDTGYINLLTEAKTSLYGALMSSNEYPASLVIPLTDNWLATLYAELEKIVSLSSYITYTLSYKLGNPMMNTRDWLIVLNIIKTLKTRYEKNEFIITGVKNEKFN